MITRTALAASLLAWAGLALPATGQSRTPLPPNLAGLWSFEADLETICTFNGHARLMPTGDPAKFDCELTAEQDCPAVDVHYIVQQSCSVDITDGVATVRSTIENFLVGEPTTGYLPDNFQLVIHDESHLEGVLLGSGAYPAEWRRAEGAIS